ncbi:hypothetical protein NPIL_594751 [Nephila pilipes]|uniref:Uncharacterized protein n=1 Tax=Nephila pilipes TaxID=299642 RepID=A0A8X6TSW6_NEPPI|nr:hypothetical protein NPIL_594751 [Nephila pilipes]
MSRALSEAFRVLRFLHYYNDALAEDSSAESNDWLSDFGYNFEICSSAHSKQSMVICIRKIIRLTNDDQLFFIGLLFFSLSLGHKSCLSPEDAPALIKSVYSE